MSPSRKCAAQNGQRFNIDDCLEFAVLGMKMRRRVIIKKHSNEDAIKTTDSWHINLSKNQPSILKTALVRAIG